MSYIKTLHEHNYNLHQHHRTSDTTDVTHDTSLTQEDTPSRFTNLTIARTTCLLLSA